jgi:hypothetical protein
MGDSSPVAATTERSDYGTLMRGISLYNSSRIEAEEYTASRSVPMDVSWLQRERVDL